ncbi:MULTISPECIES: DUF3291 domain-containing protein [unclassified Streptomyces]|uniref:DUF3291 domain-containing protein n=1 Tax=Streptomyces flavovirens TaxID=52258 RepID=A0ABV8N4I1_9ACTN|nr:MULTISPECIES: DUF3291 domain-containing protein [unclassified Streptomyces]AEN13226.1 conserved hypothetical protein [Streptomyces sp. SirexAA-E]MBK3593999.1 DUF3291 domain-containing protein [Streptomyces sp. MBT51]MYR65328.1 DUF3291 domain-containing protein [Streptomyces sp. SID4939]MYS00614.1 DUF3291 domain-containing protein [Streptomyces sp. SID4940]MYT67323.1 DUF3291 domain-containing protein [Streptomyces sp. SID8357]
MPTLPWVTPHPAPAEGTTVVMASRFEVRSLRDVPRFFVKSLVAWKQVRSAPGVFGASLIARPLKREFYTLSAWESREALHAFARTEPHRSLMTGLKPTMRTSTFTFWEAPAAGLPIDWDEAKRRVEERRRAEEAAPGKAPA